MAKMQVYLSDELYDRVKARGRSLNVSSLLQRALSDELARLDRQAALSEAVADDEAEFGAFTAEELGETRAADKRNAIRPGRKVRRSAAA